jgi:hypothetical protein
MNKEDVLLKSYAMLSKDPEKNEDALKSALQQLIEINPKLGIKCWEECIKNNLSEIEEDFGKEEFEYGSIGEILIENFESEFCDQNSFVSALEEFSKNKFLLDVLYTKSPIGSYFSGVYAISYLIRNDRLQEANNILSAIYKNKTFTEYSELWDGIIDKFEYGDNYHPGIYIPESLKQPNHIRDFCMGWIDRIKDEEERAGAMTFAMKMF